MELFRTVTVLFFTTNLIQDNLLSGRRWQAQSNTAKVEQHHINIELYEPTQHACASISARLVDGQQAHGKNKGGDVMCGRNRRRIIIKLPGEKDL